MDVSDKDFIKNLASDVNESPEFNLRLLKKILPFITMLIMAVLLWFYFIKTEQKRLSEKNNLQQDIPVSNNMQTDEMESKAVLDVWSKTLGTNLDILLPNGVKMVVPSKGVEKQLWDYIKQGCPGDMKTKWFNLDRILFKSGSAQLNVISNDQLQSVASLLKAFPGIKCKIGGYTDNQGAVESNIKLSTERATHIKNELIKLGVPVSSLESEGYGPSHPICPENDTEECRIKNRRVAIRMIKCP